MSQKSLSAKPVKPLADVARSEQSIAELCQREGIAESMYHSWSKEFLEAGKRRLAGDTAWQGSLCALASPHPAKPVRSRMAPVRAIAGGQSQGFLCLIGKGNSHFAPWL